MTSSSPHPYDRLSPEIVLDAIECFGFRCTGALTPLNSYENRVYLAEIENGDSAVAKFYRPNRWSDAAILEEHAFAAELKEREIPVIAPLALPVGGESGVENETLLHFAGFPVAVYPRIRGYAPEIDKPETLAWIGRFLGRIHAVGATARFSHRPRLGVDEFGYAALNSLLDADMLPMEVRSSYEAAARSLLANIEARMQAMGPLREIRLHGDCHAGNVLWTSTGPHFVDLDDCRTGPAVQDLWMMLSGTPAEMELQLGFVLEGYRQFHDFDYSELALIEPLRGLRAVHYCAWLATRWTDPAFPRAFPWFGTVRYWEDQVALLAEQSDRLDIEFSPAIGSPFN